MLNGWTSIRALTAGNALIGIGTCGIFPSPLPIPTNDVDCPGAITSAEGPFGTTPETAKTASSVGTVPKPYVPETVCSGPTSRTLPSGAQYVTRRVGDGFVKEYDATSIKIGKGKAPRPFDLGALAVVV